MSAIPLISYYIPTFSFHSCNSTTTTTSTSLSCCCLKSPKPVFLGGLPSTMPSVDKRRGRSRSRSRSRSNSFNSKSNSKSNSNSNSKHSTMSESGSETEMSSGISAFRSTDGGREGSYVEIQAMLRGESSRFAHTLELRGLESALNHSSKWLVSVLFGVIIIWKHDAGAMWAAMGAIINSSLSFTLKRIVNQQRPVPNLKPDPGMPSSHAQSIFYAVAFAVLSLTEWLGINAFTLTIGTFLLMCGSYFSWLRVSQQLHTFRQVAVGAILGSIFSILWFWSWNAFFFEAFRSSSWFRIILIICSVSSCLAFVLYVVKNWLLEED